MTAWNLLIQKKRCRCIALAKYCGCKLIVLDSLMMINGVSGDTAIEQRFSQTLATVARKFDTCILLVHHVRKPGQRVK